MGEISKIVLPKSEEVKKALENKLFEYKIRLKKYEGLSVEERNKFTSSGYKANISERLLEKGEVNVEEFALDLKERDGAFSESRYDNAVFVISDYLETGGKNVSGGTGFYSQNVN